MHSPNTDTIAGILESARKRGVRFWSENGQLHYRAPKGALTRNDIHNLRAFRGLLVDLVDRDVDRQSVEPEYTANPQLDHVPLAFSQLGRWHSYQLREQRPTRQVASATRLLGRLNIDALRESAVEVVRRHEALRTRIVLFEGAPTQEIVRSAQCDLKVDDLKTVPAPLQDGEVKRLIEEFIAEPIDIAVDPLFGLRLLELDMNEHILIVAMEHMISDGFSLNIVTRDLLAAYMKISKDRPVCFPILPMQFSDFAIWQRRREGAWIEEHGAFWHEFASRHPRVRFPVDTNVQTETSQGWGTIPISIGVDLKSELREWSRLRKTTLAMSVLVAYAGLVLRWCGVSEVVIQYATDGRVSPRLENTIGYFSSLLYLSVGASGDDTFTDLLGQVTKAYCQAAERRDFSYLTTQLPRPEFTRNTAFNWIPQVYQIDISDLDGSDDEITYSPVAFDYPNLKDLHVDNEPAVLLFDTENAIVGAVHFPLSRFSKVTMERFAENFLMFLRALIRQPEQRVMDTLLL